MPVAVVAGGSGSVGRSVVEAIVADGQFEVVVLSRKANPELEKTLGARVIAADYSDPDSIATLLEQNRVNTVISGLSSSAPLDQEHNLIQAVARTLKVPHPGPKLAVFEALEKTKLEWTVIASGVFLDYCGMPKIKSYLTPFTQVKLGIWQRALNRDPNNFTEPEAFIPERWLGDPRFANDKTDALQPFSYGPHNCIGKK
ncbi:hypothetical protein ACJZ2D_002115 [Fusarium nematophilum]